MTGDSEDRDDFQKGVRDAKKRIEEALEAIRVEFGNEVGDEALRLVAQEEFNLELPTPEELADNEEGEEESEPDTDDDGDFFGDQPGPESDDTDPEEEDKPT